MKKDDHKVLDHDKEPIYQSLFEQLNLPLAIVNEDGHIIEVNDSFCQLTGYTKANLVNHIVSQKIHFSDLIIDEGFLKEHKGNHLQNSQCVNEMITKNGEKKWVVLSVSMIKEIGRQSLFTLQLQNAGNDDLLSHQNCNSEPDYKSLFDQSPEAAFAMDLDGSFIWVNNAAARLAGCSKEELLKKNFKDFCDAEDLNRINQRFSEAQQGSSFNFEIGITTLRGGHRNLNVTNMPIVKGGDITGIYCISKDITEKKLIEAEKALVYRIGKIFNSQDSIDTCLRLALDEICRYADIPAADAWLINTVDKELHHLTTYLENESIRSFQASIEQDEIIKVIRKALTKKQPAFRFIEDEMIAGSEHASATSSEISLLALPILFKNEVNAIFVFYIQKFNSNIFTLGENIFIHLGSDIYRKKTEEELNRFFALSSDLLCVIGLDGSFIKINSAFSKILGFSEKEILSHTFHHFIYSEDKDVASRQLENISDDHQVIQIETRFETKEEELKWIAWTFNSLVSEKLMYGIGRDITQAKRLQKEVEREKQRFSNMFAEAPVTMCILAGPEQVFESANDLYYKFSGRKNIIGKKVREVFPEAEGQGIFEMMDWVFQTGETYNINERLVQLDVQGNGVKEDLYLSFMFQPYRNVEGQVEGIFYFGVDVTEQVAARKKIEQSKKQYVDLIQNLPVAVYTCDHVGKILLYNKAAITLWGKEPNPEKERWCGSWRMFDDEGDLIPHHLSPMALVLKGKQAVQSKELKIKKPDGSICDIVSFPSPVFDTEGLLTGGINVLVDITERKKTEEELKKLSLIARNTINAVIITNPDGQIEWVNDAFTKITGYSYNEVIGRRPAQILHGKDTDPKVVRWMSNKIQKQEAFECEILKYKKSGVPFWMEIQAQPLFDEKGNLVYYFDIETDITERKNAYEDLVKKENEIRAFARQQNNLLEEERSRIAREIHDEFGQQLTGLKMSISSLKNIDFKHVRLQQICSDMMADVESSLKSLKNISTELRPGILDTLGLVSSIEWLAKEFEKKTGIKCLLKLEVAKQFFDKELSIVFFRICQEALTNISKHADATKVVISVVQKDKELSLRISDNGKGIQKEKLNDPFSMGIIGMRERANLIGAQFNICNNNNSGTTVDFIVKTND